MDKTKETKKYFCTRCFLPIESGDIVEVDGQNFHRICSVCCTCRTIPTSLKMFYGHVFCTECFKTHVTTRFKEDGPRLQANSWWMQWGPGAQSQDNNDGDEKEADNPPEEPPKRFICARCLQPVDENHRVSIGDQSFHSQCGQCYFCHRIPTSNPKIYYGQVFCEVCFHSHVLSRNKDNPSEFFNNCFEQWQNNAQFAENMRNFMSGNKESAPFIFMMQGQQPPFCRCGTGPQDWFQANDPRLRHQPSPRLVKIPTVGIENHTEVSLLKSNESAKHENLIVDAAEKMEKLTKYLHDRVELRNFNKKWKYLEQDSSIKESFCGCIDMHDRTNLPGFSKVCGNLVLFMLLVNIFRTKVFDD